MLQATYQLLIRDAHKIGPSTQFTSRKSKLESEMRKVRESKPPPYGWNAYVATLGEEVSSKYFYRKFKAKQAKAEVGSLFNIADWNSPNLSEGEVSSNQSIAEGMAGYYQCLY